MPDTIQTNSSPKNPGVDELSDFRKFLAEKGFDVNERLDVNDFGMQLDYGELHLRINYTTRREFKNIEMSLHVDWCGWQRNLFPERFPMAKPVKSLDRDFVEHCITAAKDSMDEIKATVAKIPTIIQLELNRWHK